MAYGLQVYNADGRVQVDTTEIAPNKVVWITFGEPVSTPLISHQTRLGLLLRS